MNNKKFIIIGLAGILLISLFLNLQTYTAKQTLQQERDALKRENTLIAKKADEATRDARRFKERLDTIGQDIEKLGQEKGELQNRLDLVIKEKDELAKKLSAQPARPAVSAPPISASSAGETTSAQQEAYWGAILKAKTDLELQLDTMRADLRTAQINVEQLETEKANLELEVGSLKRDQQDFKRQLEYNQKLMDTISQEVVREKGDKFKIEESMKRVKNENSLLRRQLKSLDSRKIGLERRCDSLLKDKSALQSKLNEMEAALQEKTIQVGSLNKRLGVVQKGEDQAQPVELSPIVVRPQADVITGPAPGYLGRVMAINRENKFVVIDIGEDSGVKVGDAFQVYREDRPIANIEVIQVRKNISACDIKRETSYIKSGDTFR